MELSARDKRDVKSEMFHERLFAPSPGSIPTRVDEGIENGGTQQNTNIKNDFKGISFSWIIEE